MFKMNGFRSFTAVLHLIYLVFPIVQGITEECMGFEVLEGHSLFGFNNQIVPNVYQQDCKTLCISQTHFLCASFEYNTGTGTCYLSEEDQHTRPDDFGTNPNTDYYQRVCPGNKGQVASEATTLGPALLPSTIRDLTTDHKSTSTASSNMLLSTIITAASPRSTTVENENVPESGLNPSHYAPGEISYARKFSGESYLQLSHLYRGTTMSILTLDFTPDQSSGLLLYIDGEEEYMSLAIIDGFIEFRYELGSGPAVIRSTDTVTLGEVHRVIAARVNKEGQIKVDETETIYGQSEGDMLSFNLNSDIFLGFVTSELILKTRMMKRTGVTSGFVGCIDALHFQGFGSNRVYNMSDGSKDVVDQFMIGRCDVNNVEVDAKTTKSSTKLTTVTMATSSRVSDVNGNVGSPEDSNSNEQEQGVINECDFNPCLHGYCNSINAELYNCTCYSGYIGKNCETLLVIDYSYVHHYHDDDQEYLTLTCVGHSSNEKLAVYWLHNNTYLTPNEDQSINNINRFNIIQLIDDQYLYAAQLLLKLDIEDEYTEYSTYKGTYSCQITSTQGLVEKDITI